MSKYLVSVNLSVEVEAENANSAQELAKEKTAAIGNCNVESVGLVSLLMEKKTVEYVESDSLFAHCSLAWGAFCEFNEEDCIWGFNEITLIYSSTIEEVFGRIDKNYIEKYKIKKDVLDEILIVLKRIRDKGENFYVKLESSK